MDRIIRINQGLSTLESAAGNYQAAIACQRENIDYFSKQPLYHDHSLMSYLELGGLFLKMNQLDSADHYLQLSQRIAQERRDYPTLANSQLLLSRVKEREGDLVAALAYERAYQVFRDSMFSAELETAVAAEQVRQNVSQERAARTEAELKAELLATNNRQFKIIGFGLLGLLIIGGLLLWQLNRVRLSLAKSNLKLSETNATKDKFFGIIAHDLRNPVVGLNMVLENLRANLERGQLPAARQQSGKLEQAITRLSGLIDNLLRWALIQTDQAPYRPGNLNLEMVAMEVIELYQEYAQHKKVSLLSQLDSTLIVRADEQALRTILRNLINNALKFTASGGTVAISAHTEEQVVAISIKDNGVGMTKPTIEALFNLHTRSQPGTSGERGSGLGLRLCQELIEQNQGSIRVTSQPQTGSDFILTLPIGIIR